MLKMQEIKHKNAFTVFNENLYLVKADYFNTNYIFRESVLLGTLGFSDWPHMN